MRNLRAAFLATCILGFVGGCAWTVNMETDPPGANLYLNGAFKGTTPCNANFTFVPGFPTEANGGSLEVVFPGHDRAECPRPPGRVDMESMLVTSAPVGAEIYVDGNFIGMSPTLYHVWFPHNSKAVLPKSPYKAAAVQEKALVSCDVRIVSISDGSAVASASGQCSTEKLEVLGKGLSEKLRENMVVKGEPIAVVSLRNRSGTPQGQTLADELADKLTGALIESGWFDVKERIGLRSILEEKDLEKTDMVKSAKVKEMLAGLKYIVIGGISVSKGE